MDSFELNRSIYRLEPGALRGGARRVHRPPRSGCARGQAGAQPVARGADEDGDRRGAAAPAQGALPRRTDHRSRRHRPAQAPPVHRRVQPPPRSHRAADQPLHGRRRCAVQACHRHPPRPDPLRRRACGTQRALRRRTRRSPSPSPRPRNLSRATAPIVAANRSKRRSRWPAGETSQLASRLLADFEVSTSPSRTHPSRRSSSGCSPTRADEPEVPA